MGARGGLAAAVIGLHIVGFGLLFGFVVPHHFSLGAGGAFTAGVGLTAYTLGLRHAFDADHIAAIDNTTRKFMGEGQRPLSVGFFFSLGHSTVVFVLALLFSVGVGRSPGPSRTRLGLHSVTGLIGTSVSGTFLYLIAALNLSCSSGSCASSATCAAASTPRMSSRSCCSRAGS